MQAWGNAPGKSSLKMSAESANQGCVQVAVARRNGGDCGIAKIIAEEHAQVNRAVSATEFFLKGSWGVAPG